MYATPQRWTRLQIRLPVRMNSGLMEGRTEGDVTNRHVSNPLQKSDILRLSDGLHAHTHTHQLASIINRLDFR